LLPAKFQPIGASHAAVSGHFLVESPPITWIEREEKPSDRPVGAMTSSIRPKE